MDLHLFCHPKDNGERRCLTYDRADRCCSVRTVVSTIIGTALRKTYGRDFIFAHLLRREGEDLSKTAIAPLSLLLREVYAEDVVGLRDMLAYTQDEARNMLVLQVIHSIDWDATFAGVDLLQTGRYLYYDCNTGCVTVLPAVTVHVKTIPAINPVFLQNNLHATLNDCEADVH